MKKSILCFIFSVLCTICFVFGLVGCTSDKGAGDDFSVPTISISPENFQMEVGDTKAFTASVADNDTAKITWSVSDYSILSIDNNGVACALKAGSAKVIASYLNGKAEASVTVNEKPNTEKSVELTLNFDYISLYVENTETIIPSIKVDGEISNANFVFTSEDDSTVSIDNDGVITANKIGKTDITVSCVIDNKTYSKTVNVFVNDKIMISFSDVNLSLTSLTLNTQSGNYEPTTKQITCKVYEEGEIINGATVNFESDNEDVLTVNGSGVITANKAGKANVIATFNKGGKDYSAVSNVSIGYTEKDLTSNLQYVGLEDAKNGKIKIPVLNGVEEEIKAISNKNGFNASVEKDNTDSVADENVFIKGTTDYTLYGDKWAYKIKTYVADGLIRTGDEFIAMLQRRSICAKLGDKIIVDEADRKDYVLLNDIKIDETKFSGTIVKPTGNEASKLYNGVIAVGQVNKFVYMKGEEEITANNNDSTFFIDNFDGNGKVIGAKGEYFWTTGLFGFISGGSVRNLIVKDALIRDIGVAKGGVIAAQVQDGAVIENCVIINPIIKGDGTSFTFGMLVGHVYGSVEISHNIIFDNAGAKGFAGYNETEYTGSGYYYKNGGGTTTDEAEAILVDDGDGNQVPKVVVSRLNAIYGAIGDSAIQNKSDIYNNYCITTHNYFGAVNPNDFNEERMPDGSIFKTISDFVEAIGEGLSEYKLINIDKFGNVQVGNINIIYDIENFDSDNIESFDESWFN